MKKIFILIVCVFSLNMSAQNNIIIDSLPSKIEHAISMNTDSITNSIKGLVPDSTLPFYKQVYGDLKAATKSMAEGLGVAIKELFEIVVMQQVVKSITNIIFFLFAILFGWWSVMLGKKCKWEGDITGRGFWCVMMGLICLFFTIWTFVCINETVTGIVNPKYGAIEDIVSMAADIKNGGRSCHTCK